jgi:hypothetical protein
VGKASSAKKIAKMAEKGRGKKVRFQGGTVFPAVVALVVVLGVLLIGYSRSSSYSNAPGPRASNSDHFHIAYGIYQCNAWAPNLTGTAEDAAHPLYNNYGVHSHDDGVIHYHPRTGASSGRNAKLKRLLEVYNATLTNDKLTLPADQGGLVLEEGVTKCDVDGKQVDGELKVVVWNDAKKPEDKTILAANMSDARIIRNGMAITIAFVPKDTEVPLPESAANLDTLGAADAGGVTATTVAGTTDSTVAGSTDSTVGEPSNSTAPSGSDVTATTGVDATDAPGTTSGSATTGSNTTDAPATTV